MSQLQGETIVITGGSDGIGAAAAGALHERGATVVIIGRSPGKTRTVAERIGADHFVADFAHLDQVRSLAGALLARYPRIDLLANNAGLIGGDRSVTADGHETTFQINHLAPFLLTNLLKERLVASRARIITTSSAAHTRGHVDLADLESERTYSPFRVYGTTKLENILFTRELARRWGSQGISAAAFHPGIVATQFASGTSGLLHLLYQTFLKHFFLIDAAKGADTLVWLATHRPGDDWQSGGYYVRRRPAKTTPEANDAELAQRLWDRSAELVGLG